MLYQHSSLAKRSMDVIMFENHLTNNSFVDPCVYDVALINSGTNRAQTSFPGSVNER
jgi:hypothetical protein